MDINQIRSSNHDGYSAYTLFIALRFHFTTDSYDFVKYNGKTKVTKDSFMKRTDRYQFYKLSKKDDPFGRIISGLIVKPNLWITDLLEHDHERVYHEWKHRTDNILQTMESDFEHLHPILVDNVRCVNGETPYCVEQYLKKKISLETLTLLLVSTKTLEPLIQSVRDHFLAVPLLKTCKKYDAVLPYDRDDVKAFFLKKHQKTLAST